MPNSYPSHPRTTRRLILAAGAATTLGLAGCQVDSYMDPSITGRWEWTPTSVPILDRIASIEDQTGDLVDYSEPTAADLEPVPQTYRISAGDRVVVTIFDIITPERPEEYERQVDLRGNIDIPQLGQIRVAGLSLDEARAAIEEKVAPLVPDPLVSIVPQTQRQQTFTILGAVSSPGPYFIPGPDYRLLEAITSGGAFNNTIEYVYVIRQVSLADTTAPASPAPAQPAPGSDPSGQPVPTPPPAKPATPQGPDLLDVIDSLEPTKKPADANPTPPAPKPDPAPQPTPPNSGGRSSPGAMRSKPDSPSPSRTQDRADSRTRRARPVAAEPAKPTGDTPPIDLIEGQPSSPKPAARPSSAIDSAWVFVNGRWQQRPRSNAAGPQKAGTLKPGADMSTQRVIRVEMAPLLAGRRDVNIVIRPGDIVRLPTPPEGSIYIGGNVNRPGTYQLPPNGKLTLERAIASAGGLASTAIPSRVDFTRMTASDRQATIRLDLGAIAERTQPDIFLKPDDYINVGTNFWALPLAVFRNGFRASYGFGFLLDRNFGNDVFGVPPGTANGFGN